MLFVREFGTIFVRIPMLAHSELTLQGDLTILARMVDLRDESSYS